MYRYSEAFKLHSHHVDLVPANSVYNILMLLAVYMAHCVWGQWIIVGHGGRLGGSGPHTWWGVDFNIIDTWWQSTKVAIQLVYYVKSYIVDNISLLTIHIDGSNMCWASEIVWHGRRLEGLFIICVLMPLVLDSTGHSLIFVWSVIDIVERCVNFTIYLSGKMCHVYFLCYIFPITQL